MIDFEESWESDGSLIPDLTPLLDVIFIVLVFLLLSVNVLPKALELSLPKDTQSISEPVVQANSVTVSILAKPGWALDNKTYTDFSQLTKSLQQKLQANTKMQLILAADKNATLDKFVQLISWLQKTGYNQYSLLMENE